MVSYHRDRYITTKEEARILVIYNNLTSFQFSQSNDNNIENKTK